MKAQRLAGRFILPGFELVVLELGILFPLVCLLKDEDDLRDPGILPGSREDVLRHDMKSLSMAKKLCEGPITR